MLIGSSTTRSITEIRSFLSAESPDGLVRAQLENNLKFSLAFSYTDFTFAKGKWYCWYLIDIELLERDKLNGT